MNAREGVLVRRAKRRTVVIYSLRLLLLLCPIICSYTRMYVYNNMRAIVNLF